MLLPLSLLLLQRRSRRRRRAGRRASPTWHVLRRAGVAAGLPARYLDSHGYVTTNVERAARFETPALAEAAREELRAAPREWIVAPLPAREA